MLTNRANYNLIELYSAETSDESSQIPNDAKFVIDDNEGEIVLSEGNWKDTLTLIKQRQLKISEVHLQAGTSAIFFKAIPELGSLGLLDQLEVFHISAFNPEVKDVDPIEIIDKQKFLEIIAALRNYCQNLVRFHYCYTHNLEILTNLMNWLESDNCTLKKIILTEFIIDDALFENLIAPALQKNKSLKKITFSEDDGKYTFQAQKLETVLKEIIKQGRFLKARYLRNIKVHDEWISEDWDSSHLKSSHSDALNSMGLFSGAVNPEPMETEQYYMRKNILTLRD